MSNIVEHDACSYFEHLPCPTSNVEHVSCSILNMLNKNCTLGADNEIDCSQAHNQRVVTVVDSETSDKSLKKSRGC